MKKQLSIITGFCIVLAFCADAQAGISHSVSTIDWTSLSITGEIAWEELGSVSYAMAYDDSGWGMDGDEKEGWVLTSALAQPTQSYPTYGNAHTNDNELYEEVSAQTNGTTITYAYAEAGAGFWGYFIAAVDGYVTFSADYEISQNLACVNADEWSYGYAEAVLYLENDTDETEDEDSDILINEAWGGDDLSDSASGTFTVSLWFNAWESGYFEAWVYNEAEAEVIPEPATIAILGLGSLVLFRKRQSI